MRGASSGCSPGGVWLTPVLDVFVAAMHRPAPSRPCRTFLIAPKLGTVLLMLGPGLLLARGREGSTAAL